jgi:hypothetical protein
VRINSVYFTQRRPQILGEPLFRDLKNPTCVFMAREGEVVAFPIVGKRSSFLDAYACAGHNFADLPD